MSNQKVHQVESGDCMASIACQYGFTWQKLWNLPENAALKNQRKNPNVLLAGDEVVIPEKGQKSESRPTEARHRFRRKGTPSKFRVRMMSMGRPRADVPYVCTVDGKEFKGQTDQDGFVSLKIPPDAKSGKLVLTEGDRQDTYQVSFGQLDPIDTVSGIQQRLSNLGLECGTSGELDEKTRKAIRTYRARNSLAKSDDIDQDLRDALNQEHGA